MAGIEADREGASAKRSLSTRANQPDRFQSGEIEMSSSIFGAIIRVIKAAKRQSRSGRFGDIVAGA